VRSTRPTAPWPSNADDPSFPLDRRSITGDRLIAFIQNPEIHNMNKPVLSAFGAGLLVAGLVIAADKSAVHPAEISKADLSGAIFERDNTVRTEHEGNTVLDTTSLKSSDGKFASGMYKAGKSRSEITEPYGVDEFMYFLEGGVTLTSSDGTVTEIEAGEGVTIPKEWTGVWETDGYTKIWVIYSEDGSGL
jgi:uncharacterized cupin superfamily protein